jgi:predicted DNA-binding transcriptional regulator AlpA
VSNTVPNEPKSLNLLTNTEAAQFLKLSPRTLEKLRVTGGGPRFRKLGRRVLYARHELENWADQRACDSTSDANYLNPR